MSWEQTRCSESKLAYCWSTVCNQYWAGGLGKWLAPLPFTQFGVRFPVSAVWKKQKMFPPHPRVKFSIVGSLRDREVACSASDRQGSNFESCVWRTVPSQSSHHPQEVILAQFSLYVHKGGLKPDSFHFKPILGQRELSSGMSGAIRIRLQTQIARALNLPI